MNQRILPSGLCLLLLVLLLAAPALAASVTVTCPSGCTCLLPADAKKAGYSGYCNGKQAVCGYDTKNEKYCYEKTTAAVTTTGAAVPRLAVTFNVVSTTTKPTVAVPLVKTVSLPETTVAPVAVRQAAVLPTATTQSGSSGLVARVTGTATSSCPAGCICLRASDAALKGLAYCGGKPVSCAIASESNGKDAVAAGTGSCYSMLKGSTNPAPVLIPAVIVTNPIPLPVMCPAGSSCLDEKTISAKGYPFTGGNRTVCGYSKTAGILYCAESGMSPSGTGASASQSAPVQDGNVLSVIGVFFSSILGGSQSPSPAATGPQFRTDYCQAMYGLDSCSAGCVNLSTDYENCGRCGNWCRDTLYVTERCLSGRCVDIDSDPANCGGAGNTCPPGAPCVAGYCSALGCMDPQLTACNNSCISIQSDSRNCGVCGNACPAGQYCSAGICTSCGSGEIFCPVQGESYSRCTDVLTDINNCGRCQHECNSWGGEVCTAGVCGTCEEGSTRCGDHCADLRNSPTDCGRCGAGCSGPGQSCVNGTCTCSGGLSACANRCVDLASSATDCGECGRRCSGADQTCIDGRCSCGSAGLLACGSLCVNGGTDNRNCGRCGNICPTGTSCISGRCECAGYEEGRKYCDGSCVNTKTDQDNCGRCGNECGGYTPYCRDGYCSVS